MEDAHAPGWAAYLQCWQLVSSLREMVESARETGLEWVAWSTVKDVEMIVCFITRSFWCYL